MSDPGSAARRSAVALLIVLAAIAAGVLLWEITEPDAPVTSFPVLPGPKPVPPLDRHPLSSPIRVVVRDADITTRGGTRVQVPMLEMVGRLGGEGEPFLHLRRVVAMEPTVTAPAATGRPGVSVPGRVRFPGVRVDTFVVIGGTSRERAAPGSQWGDWRFTIGGIDLLVTDVAVGGQAPMRANLRVGLLGDHQGRPVEVRRMEGQVTRTGSVTRLQIRRGVLIAGRSRGEVSGTLVLGETFRASDLVIRFDSVYASDLARDGFDLPLPGRYAGEILVDGGPEGLQVEAELLRHHELRVSRLLVDGIVFPGPEPAVDLRVAAAPLVVDSTFEARLHVRGPVDSLAVEGVITLVLPDAAPDPGWATLTADDGAPPTPPEPGPSRPVVGTVRAGVMGIMGDAPHVQGEVELHVDPSVFRRLPGPPLTARLSGGARFPEGGVRADVRLDSVPLALVPLPAAVPPLGGVATGALVLEGPRSAPELGGTLRFSEASATLPDDLPSIERAGGVLRLSEGAVVFEDVSARAGGGALRVRGRVVPGPVAGIRIRGSEIDGPRVVDLALDADSVEVLDHPNAQLALNGRITLGGTVSTPRVDGRVRPSGWIEEDFFRPDPGLDLDDPPLAALAARAPWPAGGRLPRPPTGTAGDSLLDRIDDDRGLLDRVSGRVVATIDTSIRFLDEDSRIRGSGELTVRFEDGIGVTGAVALEDGLHYQFGTRFDVYGGAFVFEGGVQPRPSLRSELHDRASLAGGDRGVRKPERFPPVEMFIYADSASAEERAVRYTLLPMTAVEVGKLVLLDVKPQPVLGWRHPLQWTPDAGGGLLGSRATASGVPLLWGYVADEAYHYLSHQDVRFSSDILGVGESYPGRMVVGPTVETAIALSDGVYAVVSQAVATAWPRFEFIYRAGSGVRLEAFTGPRFFAAPALGDDAPGYRVRQQTGIRARWSREY